MSVDEVFKYQYVFISGLTWSAHFVSHKVLTPSPFGDGGSVPSDQLRKHFSSFSHAFAEKHDTVHPFIYPCVSGYDIAPGHGCTALNTDGTCSLHRDKPDMCRSIPFDPIVPEKLQGSVLSGFAEQHDCMVETDNDAAENLIFSEARITDPTCKADYDRRFAALQRDARLTNTLLDFMREDKPERLFGVPRLSEFISIPGRGATIETSMLPLLAVIVICDPQQTRKALDYLAAQLRLIRPAIDKAIRERKSSYRDRTRIMRGYLADYEFAQEKLPALHVA